MLPVDHRSTAARRYRTCRPISRQGGPAPAGGILLRVDPASGRVAGWLRDPRWVFQDVLADGLPRGVGGHHRARAPARGRCLALREGKARGPRHPELTVQWTCPVAADGVLAG